MATLLLALVATVAGPPEFASMAYCYLKFETAEGRRVALYKGILPQMQVTCGGGVKCSLVSAILVLWGDPSSSP
jgi:hypothetical protein